MKVRKRKRGPTGKRTPGKGTVASKGRRAGQRAAGSKTGAAARHSPRISSPIRELMEELRALVKRAAPGASESIKWGMPVFSLNGLLCYLRPTREYVRFGFYDQGIHLDDPEGILEGTGIAMRHVKVRSTADIRPALFTQWVQDAVVLNGG